MTKPKTAQPDTRRRRASTGAMMDRIMGLARRLPLTRQVLAEQLEDGHARADGVHARVDERRDRIPGTLQTRATAQTGRVPPIQGTRRLRLDTPALPRRLRASGPRIPRLRRAHAGRGHVRPARHRQDPPRPSPWDARPAGRESPPVSSPPPNWSCGYCAPARRTGSTGSSPRSAGRASWSSTSSIRPDRRGGQPPALPGRHQRVRKAERHLHHQHRVQRMGQDSSATPTWPPRSSTAPSTTAG